MGAESKVWWVWKLYERSLGALSITVKLQDEGECQQLRRGEIRT